MNNSLSKLLYLSIFIFSLTVASAEYSPRCSPPYPSEKRSNDPKKITPDKKQKSSPLYSPTTSSKNKIKQETSKKKNTQKTQTEPKRQRRSPTMYGYQKETTPPVKRKAPIKKEQNCEMASSGLLKLMSESKEAPQNKSYSQPSLSSPGLLYLMNESKQKQIAVQNSCCPPCCFEMPKTLEPCISGYNAPASIDTACGSDLWLSLSFIYWQAIEEGVSLGNQISYNSISNVTENDPINMQFNYKPGFKAGIGYKFSRDDWTLYLEYTCLNSTSSYTRDIRDAFGDNNWLESPWLNNINPNGTYSYLKSQWSLDYNIFDLSIGRPFYLGKKLVCKPFYGLKAGWIDQKYNVDAISEDKTERTITNNYYVNDSQDSWLIGPGIGIASDFNLGCNLRLFGNIASALTYQKFKATINEQFPLQENNPAESIVKGKNNIHSLTPNIDFSLGFGYGKYFSNSRIHFDIIAGYDFQYIWKQRMINHQKISSSYISESERSNLMLHGLTITTKLAF